MSCNRHTLRPFPALVAMCLLASCASEGQTLGKGFLVSDTDTLQVHPVPGRVHSAHLHVKWL